MRKFTKAALVRRGAVVQGNSALLDGVVFTSLRDANLFIEVEVMERDPFHGGVNYFGKDGLLVLKKEYPCSMTESGADNRIAQGLSLAAQEGVFVYLMGSKQALF